MLPAQRRVKPPEIIGGKGRLGGGKLRQSCVERPRGQFIQRARAQFLVEDFDANRAAVSRLRDLIEKTADIEFAFPAELPVIDRVFVQAPGGGECAVIDLNAEEILERKASDLL